MSTFEEKLAARREPPEPERAPQNSRTQHGMEEYARTAEGEHEQMKALEKLRGDFVQSNQRHPKEGELDKWNDERTEKAKDQPAQAQGERGGYPSAMEAKQAMLDRQAAHKREQASQQRERMPEVSIER